MKKAPLHPRKRIDTKVVSSDLVTPTVKHMAFLVGDDFEFTPGQYVTLQTKVDERVRARAYSIFSSFPENGNITLSIKLVEDGLVTPKLFTMKPGDKLDQNVSQGRFHSRQDNLKIW